MPSVKYALWWIHLQYYNTINICTGRGRVSHGGSRLWTVRYIRRDGRSFASASAVLHSAGRLAAKSWGFGEEEAEESASVSPLCELEQRFKFLMHCKL